MTKLHAQIELLDYIDSEITDLIKRNAGARTQKDILAVFNGTLLLMHEIRSDLYHAKTNQIKSELDKFVSSNRGGMFL